MRAHVITEPELEFGGAGRHIDPRFGISDYGPADVTTPDAPQAVRVGIIGPGDAVDGCAAGWSAAVTRSRRRTSGTRTSSPSSPAAMSTEVSTPQSWCRSGRQELSAHARFARSRTPKA